MSDEKHIADLFGTQHEGPTMSDFADELWEGTYGMTPDEIASKVLTLEYQWLYDPGMQEAKRGMTAMTLHGAQMMLEGAKQLAASLIARHVCDGNSADCDCDECRRERGR